MGRTVAYETKAKDGVLTLDELREFLRSVDGLPGRVVPRVRISFGGGIRSIKATEEQTK